MQIKRGLKIDLPDLKDGELGLCLDTNELYIGNDGNKNILLGGKLVNNLTTGGADNILSAEQGKMLKEQLDDKADKDEITGGLTYKGSCLYVNLPTSNRTVGDYWYCSDGTTTDGAGNYAWNGTAWYYGGDGNNVQILDNRLDELENVIINDMGFNYPDFYNLLSCRTFGGFLSDKIIKQDTGAVVTSAGYKTTNVIPINPTKEYSLNNGISGIYMQRYAFYSDVEGTIYLSSGNMAGTSITVPESAKSIRFSITDNAYNTYYPNIYFYSGSKSVHKTTTKTTLDNVSIPYLDDELENLRGEVYEIPSYWQTTLETAEETINELNDSQGINSYSFGLITDIHLDANNEQSSKLLKHITNNTDVDIIVNCGDDAKGLSKLTKQELANQLTNAQLYFSKYKLNVLPCIGNHDFAYDDTPETTGYLKNIDNCEIYNLMLNKENLANCTFGENGTYYYYDDIRHKTRFIILNCFDYPLTVDDNGYANPNKMYTFLLSNEQLTFIENAVNLPSNWCVVVCSHVPPIAMTENSTSYISNGTDAITKLNNSDATIIGWFCGHIHSDQINITNGINIVSTVCDASVGNALKTSNTTNEQAFDIVTIQKNTKTVKLTRIGSGSDRTFIYQ